MENILHVSSNPHTRSKLKSSYLMYSVVIALMPAAIYGVWLNGPYAGLILVLTIASAVVTELLFEKIAKRPVTISDGSAIVTGLLLGMNMPPQIPFWMPMLGSVFAILIVKQFFGGLGHNIMNPALAGRVFLIISFAGYMTNFAVNSQTAAKIVDTVSGATPLAAVKAGESVDLLSMFLGNTRGTIGETSALCLLIGAAFLVIMKVIDLRVPLTYLAVFSVFVLIFGGRGFDLHYLATELCGGGLMLGAWFMATDYVTRPITKKGRYVYGIFLGVLTGVFRVFGASAEGVSYAIILCNILVPLIEKATMPRGFGIRKEKGGEKA